MYVANRGSATRAIDSPDFASLSVVNTQLRFAVGDRTLSTGSCNVYQREYG